MGAFEYSWLDFAFSSVGLPLFLLDVVLDVLAAVNFYQDEAYGSLGVLLLFLVGSSVLVQVYSWLWYSYDRFEMVTQVEKSVNPSCLKLLHVLQLGIYFRHLGVLETSVKSICQKSFCPKCFRSRSFHPNGGESESEDRAVYLSHDLSMLRIVETFSESAPQLVLMLTIILQGGHFDPITVLKAVVSASAVAFCVTMYHRSLRSFLPTKNNPTLSSSIVFFFWNFLLITSRLAALALFASVLPCFIFTHFFCSWMLFFFFAWRAKTDFMESVCGEWLYRTTVALIWYFDWFGVVEGRTRYITLLYHGFILVDISVLCGVWCWKMSTDPPSFVVPPLNAAIAAACVVFVYILGLLLKLLYYKCFHPNVGKEELKGDSTETPRATDEVDTCAFRSINQSPSLRPPPSEHCNRRMRKLAENFYA